MQYYHKITQSQQLTAAQKYYLHANCCVKYGRGEENAHTNTLNHLLILQASSLQQKVSDSFSSLVKETISTWFFSMKF